MKLNLKPNIFTELFLLLIKQSVTDFNPLSRILLWPNSKHYRVGWVANIFSATDFAPSKPILLLNKLRYFKDLLFLRETANS